VRGAALHWLTTHPSYVCTGIAWGGSILIPFLILDIRVCPRIKQELDDISVSG
jgi:hypothetical protein